MIATTINMHKQTVEALNMAAQGLNTSKRDIIVRLLMRLMRDFRRYQAKFSTVRYQPDNPAGKWHCFSVRFKADENEFFTDLRKICKCSVSYLVAIAVKKYLNDILNEVKETVHNNACFCNYIIRRSIIDGIVCWQLYWGMPKNHRKVMME